MPNTTSAKKRLRQNVKRRTRNRSVKSAVKSQVRKVREAASTGDWQKAEQEFRLAVRKLDRAGSHHIIHPNAAARIKSRLQKAIKAAKAAQTVA